MVFRIKYCSVRGCFNSGLKTPDLSFHNFPSSLILRQKWCTLLNIPIMSCSSLVCSAHFSNDCFINWGGKRRLKSGALPSLLLYTFDMPENLIVEDDLNFSCEETLSTLLVNEADRQVSGVEIVSRNVTSQTPQIITEGFTCEETLSTLLVNEADRQVSGVEEIVSGNVTPHTPQIITEGFTCEETLPTLEVNEADLQVSGADEEISGTVASQLKLMTESITCEETLPTLGVNEVDLQENKCPYPVQTERCCICSSPGPVAQYVNLFKDAEDAVKKSELTSFGLVISNILNMKPDSLLSKYSCQPCSQQVLGCFESVIDLNVSALLARRRAPQETMTDVLNRGCELCGTVLPTVEEFTDHYIDHILQDTKQSQGRHVLVNSKERLASSSVDGSPVNFVQEESVNHKCTTDKGKENKLCYTPKTEQVISRPQKLGHVKKKEGVLVALRYENGEMTAVRAEHSYVGENKVDGSLLCHYCGCAYLSRCALKKHIKRHNYIDIKRKTKKMVGEKKLYQQRDVKIKCSDRERFVCDICKTVFDERFMLSNHKVMAHKIKMYDICGRANRPRDWLCDACGQNQQSWADLKKHCREQHDGAGMIDCEMCHCSYQPATCSERQMDRQIFIKNFVAQGVRRDGRGFEEFRPTAVNVKSLRHAEGSAIVRHGKTTVVCGIKAELAKPKAETPNEGYLVVNVELPPLCSPLYLPGPPSDDAQAATALVEKALLSTQAVCLTDLCLVPDRLAWVLYLDIICLSLDGGLLAAAVCAASAALMNTTLPTVEMDLETGLKTVSTACRKPLPVNSTPFATTFALFDEALLQDPTTEEETMATGLVTAVVCSEPGRALPLYMPGSRPLSPKDLTKCMEATRQRAQHLQQLLHVAKDSPER